MKGQVTHTQYLLPLRALLEAIKQIGTFCLQTDLPTFLVANSNSSLLGDLSLSHVTPQRMKDFTWTSPWRTLLLHVSVSARDQSSARLEDRESVLSSQIR